MGMIENEILIEQILINNLIKKSNINTITIVYKTTLESKNK